jgi:hypothetical protein
MGARTAQQVTQHVAGLSDAGIDTFAMVSRFYYFHLVNGHVRVRDRIGLELREESVMSRAVESSRSAGPERTTPAHGEAGRSRSSIPTDASCERSRSTNWAELASHMSRQSGYRFADKNTRH